MVIHTRDKTLLQPYKETFYYIIYKHSHCVCSVKYRSFKFIFNDITNCRAVIDHYLVTKPPIALYVGTFCLKNTTVIFLSFTKPYFSFF